MLRASQLIGLDIGTTAVKAARIRRRGSRVVVTGLARVAIDLSNQEGRSILESAAWRCLQALGGGAVVCGLSGPEVAVRTFEFPPLPRKQLASAVSLEASQVCPFEIGDGAVAYQVLHGPAGRLGKGETSERMVGVFAAAENHMVQERRTLCEGAQGRCVMVDVDGLALLNCLEACRLRNEGEAALVLNLGYSYTNLAIVSDNGLPFVRDIAYAGDHVMSHVCRSTGASRPAVIAALGGSGDSMGPAAKFQPSLQQACSTLADRVAETVRYYQTRQSRPAVDQVFLCGGLSQATVLTQVLVPLLAGKVNLWNPLTMLACTRAVRESGVIEHGPAFAVALGLAMRTLRDVHD